MSPREQITFNPIVERFGGGTTDEGEPVATVHVELPRRNVHVSWNTQGQWVQLGIDVSLAELRQMVVDAEAEAKRAEAATPEGLEYFTEAHPFRIISDLLDRPELNRLIRTTRRARDQAYGRDE